MASDYSPGRARCRSARRRHRRRPGAGLALPAAGDRGHLETIPAALDLAVGTTREARAPPRAAGGTCGALAEKLGAVPKHPVIFECVGVPGVIESIVDSAPLFSRVVVVGVCVGADSFTPAMAITKEIDLRFVRRLHAAGVPRHAAHARRGQGRPAAADHRRGRPDVVEGALTDARVTPERRRSSATRGPHVDGCASPDQTERSSRCSSTASLTTRSSCSIAEGVDPRRGTSVPSGSRAIRPTRSSASTSRPSTRRRTVDRDHPAYELEVADARRAATRRRAGASARTASRFWANVVITAIRDEHGSLLGFGKVTRDLTARRLVEEQLRGNALALQRPTTSSRSSGGSSPACATTRSSCSTPAGTS